MVKNKLFSIILSIMLLFSFNQSFAKSLKRQNFPIEQIAPDLKNNNHHKIVVFMPTLTEQTDYSSMIIQAFKHYFVNQLAFAEKDRKNIQIDVVLVSAKATKKSPENPITDKTPSPQLFLDDESVQIAIYQQFFDTTGMTVSENIPPKLKQALNLPDLSNVNDDSVLFLLDKQNRIVFRDNQYRGQGEHLKPLEHKLQQLSGLPVPRPTATRIKPLHVGDVAPDIALVGGKKLSDYKGQVVVLTFYPAAFSGTFNLKEMVQKRSRQLQMQMMSCSGHIWSMDKLAIDEMPTQTGNSATVFFAASESTPELLTQWRNTLETFHIGYVNDTDYSAAQQYGALA